jgi:SAM-dependent methyltransferase
MTAKVPWWKSQFLDPVITEIEFGWKTNTKAEVDHLLREMDLPRGAHILDLACGQGRHSFEFARRGFRVTGLDYSPLLLSRAVALAGRLPSSRRPTFIEGDMRELRRIFPAESFDAVVNLWNAWGYFDRRSDDRKTLSGISYVLKSGGSLVINTLNEGGVIQKLQGTLRHWHEEKKGRYFLHERDYDNVRKKLSARWTLIGPKEGLLKHYPFSQNVYLTQDFRRELRRVGLRMTKLWGMLEGKPYSKRSWHQTFIARKMRREN